MPASAPSDFGSPYFFHLALLNIDSVGPKLFQRCHQHFEHISEAFYCPSSELLELGLAKKSVEQIQNFSQQIKHAPASYHDTLIGKRIKENLIWSQHAGHHIVAQDDEAYPFLLKQIYDPPPLLFVIGNLELLAKHQVAIVGSRRASKAGALFAKTIAAGLVGKNFVVTSGLANGIDTFAHEGAVSQAKEGTLAVLAHGLDGIYPKRNKTLAANIINSGGALVSEFPVGVKPRPEYFPRRNRIISGLSLGVLVVEATEKSGSLVTAYCALEQNREVFAVPGMANNPVSKGCHQLIQQGAKLVEDVDDILVEFPRVYRAPEILGNESKASPDSVLAQQQVSEEGAEPLERKILKSLDVEQKTANDIAEELNVPVSEISAALTLLELKGSVQVLDRGYQRCSLTISS